MRNVDLFIRSRFNIVSSQEDGNGLATHREGSPAVEQDRHWSGIRKEAGARQTKDYSERTDKEERERRGMRMR